jgi:hypothetical protein
LILCLNPPDFENGMARDLPYAGGFEEIQIELVALPDVLTPPPQGPGATPFAPITQKAR